MVLYGIRIAGSGVRFSPGPHMYIPIISGTAREGNNTQKVARFVLEKVKEFGLETQLLDVKDFPETATGKESKALDEVGEKLRKAEGFLIVSPEYNHGYPGELKLFLDYFYEEFNRKPIGFCGTGGTLGGGRMVEQMRLVAIELQMVPIRNAVYFMQVKTLFDEQGNLKDPSLYKKGIENMLEELVWYAKALKTAREG